jgi:transcriptional regulator with XRE-family HTH domain
LNERIQSSTDLASRDELIWSIVGGVSDEARPSVESAFAQNLKKARAASGMTQAELAKKMTDRGYKWHAATVYKVENEERQIQLGEALEAVRIFTMDIEDMVKDSQVAELVTLRQLREDFEDRRGDIRRATTMYLGYLVEIVKLLESDDVVSLVPPDELEAIRNLIDLDTDFNKAVASVYRSIQQS